MSEQDPNVVKAVFFFLGIILFAVSCIIFALSFYKTEMENLSESEKQKWTDIGSVFVFIGWCSLYMIGVTLFSGPDNRNGTSNVDTHSHLGMDIARLVGGDGFGRRRRRRR